MSTHYVICINNEGYEVSLERRKIYEVVSDASAQEHSQIRVIDESGEDYVYPSNFFVSIDLPKAIEDQLTHAA